MNYPREHVTVTAEDTAGESHYLRAVTRLGDSRSLVLARPVFSASGVKLLDTGARINSHVLDRLIEHKLAAPIEQCVNAADAVDHPALVARARDLAAGQPLLAKLVAALDDADALWSALAGCPLPPPLLFRLTVAREQRTALYEHSLRAAVLSLFLALRSGVAADRPHALATAALLHDIGMLHADPALFEDGQPLNMAGRRMLYAHPLTGKLIVERERGIDPAIAAGIAQHHERLDGSGYPAALMAERIGEFGRILMLVEVALATLEHGQPDAEPRLSLILRLNHRSFDRRLTATLLPHLAAESTQAALAVPAQLEQVNRLLADWYVAHTRIAPEGVLQRAAVDYAADRVGRLRRSLYEAGLGSDLAVLGDGSLASDPATQAEHAALIREAAWQLRQIAFETTRRWPELADPARVWPLAPLAKWLADVEATTRRVDAGPPDAAPSEPARPD